MQQYQPVNADLLALAEKIMVARGERQLIEKIKRRKQGYTWHSQPEDPIKLELKPEMLEAYEAMKKRAIARALEKADKKNAVVLQLVAIGRVKVDRRRKSGVRKK